SAEDPARLRMAWVPGARLLIVGAGLIGAETASTAAGLGCNVTLADPVSPPLSGAFGADIADWLHGLHENNGVTTIHAAVEKFNRAASGISATFVGHAEARDF